MVKPLDCDSGDESSNLSPLTNKGVVVWGEAILKTDSKILSKKVADRILAFLLDGKLAESGLLRQS